MVSASTTVPAVVPVVPPLPQFFPGKLKIPKEIRIPRIAKGLYADHADGSVGKEHAFCADNESLFRFYERIRKELWCQYKTSVEVSNWDYISPSMGKAAIITGVAAYAFYDFLFRPGAPTDGAAGTLSGAYAVVKGLITKGGAAAITQALTLFAKTTGIPVQAIDPENIKKVMSGLSFTLAAALLISEIRDFQTVKMKAANYAKIFDSNVKHATNTIGNVAEYMTLRFSALILKLPDSEIDKLAYRLLKQFASNIAEGKPGGLTDLEFVLDSIAPLENTVGWKGKCLCYFSYDKTVTMDDGKVSRVMTYEELTTKAPLLFMTEIGPRCHIYEFITKRTPVDVNNPAQIVISDREYLKYGFSGASKKLRARL